MASFEPNLNLFEPERVLDIQATVNLRIWCSFSIGLMSTWLKEVSISIAQSKLWTFIMVFASTMRDFILAIFSNKVVPKEVEIIIFFGITILLMR